MPPECWRLVDAGCIDGPTSASMFEAIGVSRSKAAAPNTILLWRVSPPCVYLGYHQLAKNEINLASCKELGIRVVRRILGGGCTYCDADQLLYSVVMGEDHPKASRSMEEIYRVVLTGVLKGLWELGLRDAYHDQRLNAIIVNGKKISGNAGFRADGIIMVNGNVLLDFDHETMCKVLLHPLKNLPGNPSRTEEGLTDLRRELVRKVQTRKVEGAFRRGFEEALDMKLVEGVLTPEELEGTSRMRKRYLSDSWSLLMDKRRERLMRRMKTARVAGFTGSR